MGIHFLESEKVYFCPYHPKDAWTIHQWFNDPVVTHYMFTGQKPTTLNQVKNSMKRDIKSDSTSTTIKNIRALMNQEIKSPYNIIFIVCDSKSQKEIIGMVGLYEIDETSRKAEMRIIIGNKEYWGKGYGTEITEMINFYGFDRLNFNRIHLGVTEENKGGVRAYEKAGYTYEGTLKQEMYRNSRYYDAIRMAILRDDYYKKYYKEHKERFFYET